MTSTEFASNFVPNATPASVIAAAQAKHKAAFDGWFKKYVKS